MRDRRAPAKRVRPPKTAFVFAGGGSLGAVQAGMLRELTRRGVSADFVVGSSVGAMNASYFASAPNPAGIEKLGKIWRALRRHDVFPASSLKASPAPCSVDRSKTTIHQRRQRDPAKAPVPTTKVIANVYQAATKSGESSGQCVA